MYRVIAILLVNLMIVKAYGQAPSTQAVSVTPKILEDLQYSFSFNSSVGSPSNFFKELSELSGLKTVINSEGRFAPSVPVFTTGKANVCAGTSGVVYAVANDPAVTYTWSYSGTGVQINGSSNSVTLDFGTNATSGNLNVTATENGSTSAPAVYAITVNVPPNSPTFTTGFTTVCAGSATVGYSVLNDPTVTYSWSYTGTGAVITGGTTDKVTVFYNATATSGLLQVTATKNGCSAQSALPISVNPKPTTPTFTASAANLCTGATGKIYTVTNDPTVNYTWSYSGTGATITNGATNSVIVDYSNAATAGSLTVTASKSGCSSSSSIFVTVSSPPAQPTFTSGSSSVCFGASGVPYSVNAVTGLNYTWTYSGTGAVINTPSANNTTIDYSNSATPGNLTVTAANSGCSTSASMAITFNGTTPAKPVFTASTVAVCAGMTGVAYSVANDPTATYAWTYSGTGATINNPSLTNITVDYSNTATAGNLIVTVTKGGCSSSSTLSITMGTLPTPSITAGSLNLCAGSTGINYSVANDPTVNYAWSYSGTGAVINNSSSNSITVDFTNNATSGNLTVLATKNGCSSSSSAAVTVKAKPSAPTQFTSSKNTVCQGMTGVQYSVANDPSVTYNWSYAGSGVSVNSTSNTASVDFSGTAVSGTLSVKSVLNGCESAPLSIPVTVIPLASSITPDFSFNSVCVSSNALFTNTTNPAIANISTFAWDFGNGQTSASKDGSTTYVSQGTYAVKLTATITACPTISGSVTKNISVIAQPAGIEYDTIIAIRGVPVNLSARNIGTTYSWSPATGLSFSNTMNTTLVPTQTQRFLISISAASGCTTVDTQFVQVASKTGLYIPTLFSPNGDGRNDLLAPLPVGMSKLNYFRVYNRWGNLVYEQRNSLGAGLGWNGKYKGVDQPAGVYIWIAEGIDIDNKVIRVDGNTVLIR